MTSSIILNAILDHIPLWLYLVVGGVLTAVVLYFCYPILIPLWRILPMPVKVALIFVVSMVGAVLAGRYRGAKDERDLEAQRNAEAVQKRKEVDNAVDSQTPAQTNKKLDPWMRD